MSAPTSSPVGTHTTSPVPDVVAAAAGLPAGRLGHVLLWYDGPRLVSVEPAPDGPGLLGACADEDQDGTLFIWAAVPADLYARICTGTAPLREAFTTATQVWLDRTGSQVLDMRAGADLPEQWLPAPGATLPPF